VTRLRTKEAALRELVSAAAVRARVEELSGEIAAALAGTRPLVVVIAEGARRFAEALAGGARAHGLESDSLVVSVRRTEGAQLRAVAVTEFDAARCRGRHVVVVDDIADEGRTLAAVLERVGAAGPVSLRTAVLVNKLARRLVPLSLDFVGFQIEDGWVVGFGMDLSGRFRDLDHLAVVQPPPVSA
jgi:hypoxanthine phosphoribosyltransferase